MKRIYDLPFTIYALLVLWGGSLAIAQLPANNIAPAALDIVTDTNGVLLAPTNFFHANSAAMNAEVSGGSGSQSPLVVDVNGASHNITNLATMTANRIIATNLVGQAFPYDTNFLYLVFGGDSQTASVTNYPYILRSNYYGWSTAKFFTNQAVTGVGFTQQTNTFWTSTFPMLQAMGCIPATGKTNVIVSLLVGANDMPTTDYATYIYNESNFISQLHSYGIKYARLTVLPRGSWLNTSTMNCRYMVNRAILFGVTRTSGNATTNGLAVDFPVDASSVVPDCTDINFYYDANASLPVAQLHPGVYGQELIAREWDDCVRGHKTYKQLQGMFREGPYWVSRDSSDGHLTSEVDTNGVHYGFRAGGPPTVLEPYNVGALVSQYNAGLPALIVEGSTDAVSSTVLMRLETSGGSPTFYWYNNGGFQTFGNSMFSSGATLTFITGSGGQNFLNLSNQNASTGRNWAAGSQNDGSFTLHEGDSTSSTNMLTIGPTGITTILEKLIVTKTNAPSTITSGLEATNSTDPTVSTVQFTPSLSLRGKTYNTSVGLPQPFRWDLYGVGTNNITNYSRVFLSVNTNNSSPVTPFIWDQDGGFTANTFYGSGSGITNITQVSSVTIPMGQWFGYTDGASLVPATPTNFPSGDGFYFDRNITNTINVRWTPPWDWNAGTVKVGINAFCTGTNSSTATNVVFGVRAGAIGDGDNATNIIWGSLVTVTNHIATNSFTSRQAITLPVTVGNSPSTSKAVVWQLQRLGSDAGDTMTNLYAVVSDVRIYYQKSTTATFPTSSP